jgi:hypothetical protein
MKRFLQLTLVGLALSVAPLARAGTYQDGDVLLIFREFGFNDVEFDIGNISQFLNQPIGSTVPVTGWTLATATGVFGSDLTGVSFIVAATQAVTNSDRLAWLSSANPGAGATISDVTPSAWQANLWSIIDSVGTRPITYQVPSSGTGWSYSIDPQGSYKLASYDNIVTDDEVNGGSIAEFGGHAPFSVEGVIPASLGFWQIQGTNANPKPPAAYIGSFIVDAAGDLTFTAGQAPTPTPPTILGITRAGGVSTVTFTTSPSGNYSLVYTNTLGSPISTWPVVGASVAGNGANQSLTYTNSSDSAGFYGVLVSP